jgi:ribosomal protein S18 acetylase RimI-like enzyme
MNLLFCWTTNDGGKGSGNCGHSGGTGGPGNPGGSNAAVALEARSEGEDEADYKIIVNGEHVGDVNVIWNGDEDDALYVERIDINESERNKGIGTAAIRALQKIYPDKSMYSAPDNDDAKRLWERIGEPINALQTPEWIQYSDQGYGVYEL